MLSVSRPLEADDAQNYTENFIQAILCASYGALFSRRLTRTPSDGMPEPGAKGSTLVVGGDGRFYSPEVIQLIVKVRPQRRCFAASW